MESAEQPQMLPKLAAETQNWLDFAVECGYLLPADHERLWGKYEQVTRGLVTMMTNPDDWCAPATLVRESLADYAVEDDPGG